jgi:catechol-2,3-dioxygenase
MTRRRLVDHVTLNTRSSSAIAPFYEAALRALDVPTHVDEHGRLSFGDVGQRDFGIYEHGTEFFERSHTAFVARSQEEVRAFHQAAIEHGGRSLDGPRTRPEFGGLYSAYVEDPEGNVVEVIFDPAD